MKLFADVADQYAEFAEHAKDSPCFEEWARCVADDRELQTWIARLEPIKQQPNLVFAAARWHGVEAPGPYAGLRDALLDDDGSITATIAARSTQTNEVGRLATLAPVFARVAEESGRPLALLEAGASAGLCLYPDRYTYSYRVGAEAQERRWTPGEAGPVLTCRAKGEFSVPATGFEVAWRGGLDLEPLDVHDEDAMAWLENLVWPEQDERRERLRAAIDIARAEGVRVRRGDILTDLPEMAAEAAEHGEVVVFHTAVIAYLEPADRERFEHLMRELVGRGACRWVSNEDKKVFPRIAADGPAIPEDHPTFVLGLDGRELAWTHGHGRSLTWHGAGDATE